MSTPHSLDNEQTYIGRFAPSPTGPLHFGSLVAAAASYLQALTNSGFWLLRIEDIDPPREHPGADQLIIDALEAHGFQWHGDVIYQSSSAKQHQVALRALLEAGLAYPCSCSRRDLLNAPSGALGTIYPGHCRDGHTGTDTAIRARTTDEAIGFKDGLQGAVEQRLQSESGDFIVQRRDGLVAYHLAVVVDDYLQGVTEVVRGVDLLDSTPRQIWLQRLLGYPTPDYLHIPVVTHRNGDKLSKLTGAAAVPSNDAVNTLLGALRALRMDPPNKLRHDRIENIWRWAADNWQSEKLLGVASVPNLA